MNKRLKKKIAKKMYKGIPVGHGVITGNANDFYDKDSIHHYYPIGTIVEILKESNNEVSCLNRDTGISQFVSKHHINIKK